MWACEVQAYRALPLFLTLEFLLSFSLSMSLLHTLFSNTLPLKRKLTWDNQASQVIIHFPFSQNKGN